MIMLMAVIRPHRLDEVIAALADIGATGVTVTEVKGHGRQKGQAEIYRGAEYQANYIPKLKLEIVIDDAIEDDAIEAIRSSAMTGKIGDGKIFIYDISRVVRIRTGETGSAAI